MAVNKANKASWRPSLPIFDPQCGRFEAEATLCLLGRNEEGEVVLSQAARFFDWRNTSFYEEGNQPALVLSRPRLAKG